MTELYRDRVLNPVNLLPASGASGTATARRPATRTTPPGPLDLRAAALMALLCLLWGLQQVSLKAVSGQASPMLMIGLRSGIAALLLAGLMAWRGEVPPRSRWWAGAAAGSLFALEYLLVAQALQWTTASRVVVFLYTSPLFTALGLHWWRPQERLTRRASAGLAVAFAGVAVAFLDSGASAGAAGATGTAATAGGDASRALWGDALAVAAGLAMGATTVVLRCTRLATAPPTETLLYQLLAAFVLLVPGAWLTGQAHWQGSATVWLHLAFQSLVVSFASFLVWCWLLTRYWASRLGAFGFLTPLFGVAFGVLLLGETLAPGFTLGGGLVLAGIALVTRR